jgi:hypothetical protein
MSLVELGRIASSYETDMAHALLTAIAIAHYEGTLYGWM